MHSRRYFDLSSHKYISDDENIYVDEELGIVKINEGVTPGLHKITSTLGGEVEFNVSSEHAIDINIDKLNISNVEHSVCPEQIASGYIGQTITLANSDILKEHALVVKSDKPNIYAANIKKSIIGGLFNFKNQLFIIGNVAGSGNIITYLYDKPEVNLDYQVECDTMENLFHYRFELYFDHVLIDQVNFELNKRYLFEVKIHYIDDDTYEEVTYLDISKIDNVYKLGFVDDEIYVTFVSEGDSYMVMSYHYHGTYTPHRSFFKVVNPNKSNLSNVDPKTIRKSIGHAMLHLLATLFLILFLNIYLDNVPNKWWIILIASILSLFLAVLSELIQLFIPGRCFDFIDILIDYSGSLLALLIMSIVFLIKAKKAKEKLPN